MLYRSVQSGSGLCSDVKASVRSRRGRGAHSTPRAAGPPAEVQHPHSPRRHPPPPRQTLSSPYAELLGIQKSPRRHGRLTKDALSSVSRTPRSVSYTLVLCLRCLARFPAPLAPCLCLFIPSSPPQPSILHPPSSTYLFLKIFRLLFSTVPPLLLSPLFSSLSRNASIINTHTSGSLTKDLNQGSGPAPLHFDQP